MVKRLTGSINRLLDNLEASSDVEWWKEAEIQDALVLLVEGEESYACTSDTLGITQEGDSKKLVFAVYRGEQQTFQDQVQEQVSQLAQDAETRVVHLTFFVRDMRERVSLEEMFSRKACREMAERARQAAGRKQSPRVVPPVCILMQKYPKQPVTLDGLSTFSRVCEPPVDGSIHLESRADAETGGDANSVEIQAMTFTASLYKLVQLYNLVGDQLFRNNVRFGIKEVMGVDRAIRQTLEDEPERFYFKNNGITILAGNTRPILTGSSEIVLGEIGPDTAPNFSVVNGAQTITAAAQHFFELEYRQTDRTKTEEERNSFKKMFEDSKAQAKVLVRIIQLSEGAAGEQLAREISIALNRQKPIRMEDIAATIPDVQKLGECAQGGAVEPFRLIRQGEDVKDIAHMRLIEFARARIACANSPGDARTKGERELLKTQLDQNDRYIFTRKDLVAPDWADAEGEQEIAIFRRDYGAVLFAHQVVQEYERRARDVKAGGQDYLNAVRNGRWYFAAALVQMLNGFRLQEGTEDKKRPDFTGFSFRLQDVREKIPQAMELFARLVGLCALDRWEVNSNLFKGDTLYHEILQGMKSGFPLDGDSLGASKDQLACQLMELFQVSRPEKPAFAPDNESQSAGSVPEGHVLLGTQLVRVSSDAHALEKVSEYILNHYPTSWATLYSVCSNWITFNEELARISLGYFRGAPRRIMVDGKYCWIGTSSNTKTKCRCMRQLCEVAEVPKGTIRWHKKGQPGITFDW